MRIVTVNIISQNEKMIFHKKWIMHFIMYCCCYKEHILLPVIVDPSHGIGRKELCV